MTTEKTAPAGQVPAEPPAPEAAIYRRRRSWLVFLRDVLVIVLIAVLVSFLVKTFVVRSFYIPSGSMEDTLLINDRILVDEVTPALRRLRARRHRRLPGSRAAGCRRAREPARPPIVEGIDWVLSRRRALGPRQRRPPRQAHHRAAGRPRRLLQRARADHRSTTSRSTRPTYVKLPTGESRGLGRPVRRRRARGAACGCSATTATGRRTRATTPTSRARASCRSRTSSGARS